MTTFFNHNSLIEDVKHTKFFVSTATISKISEWSFDGSVYIVAELKNCNLTPEVKSHCSNFAFKETVPHITLLKNANAGDSAKFNFMIDSKVEFEGFKIKIIR